MLQEFRPRSLLFHKKIVPLRRLNQSKHIAMSTNTVDNTRKVTTIRLREMKNRGEKIAMLTAYDFSLATPRGSGRN